MALADQRTSFAITLPADAPAEVIVAGVDVTEQVSAFRLDAAEGRTPILTLIGQAGGAVIGDGIVQTDSAQPLGEAVAEFLSKVDPVQLEQAALRRDVPYGEAMTMQAALLVLTDWARGG